MDSLMRVVVAFPCATGRALGCAGGSLLLLGVL